MVAGVCSWQKRLSGKQTEADGLSLSLNGSLMQEQAPFRGSTLGPARGYIENKNCFSITEEPSLLLVS